MHFYCHALAQEPPSRGYEIYNFGRHFLGNNYDKHVLRSSDPFLEVEKKILIEIMRLLYGLYSYDLAQGPLPRGLEICKFIRGFLGHHYNVFSLFT